MSKTLLRNNLAATFAIASLGIAIPSPAQADLPVGDEAVEENVPLAETHSHSMLIAETHSHGMLIANGVYDTLNSTLEHFIPSAISAKVGSDQTQSVWLEDTSVATIYAHDMDGKPAATVYVRNIPTFTFLGEANSQASDASAVTLSQPSDAIVASDDSLDIADPAVRATMLAAQINQYYRQGGAADAITVRWDDTTEEILVEAREAWALSMDSTVIFPDTTGELAQDALHATNMLRRQLGGAVALSEVEGLPRRSVRNFATASFSGMASWYGPGFHGRMSASGERFNQNAMTAAHRTLPFGTVVQVTNLNTGASTTVRINDRGPYAHNRVIDLSAAAARAIGMIGSGVAPVSVEVLE